jgi:hypothetical protein
MRERWRVSMVIGSLARLAYGLGSMLAPEWMARNRLAPSLRDHPDPRMNLRGFGGAQSGIALYTLAAATTPERARAALSLNLVVDAFDAGVSALEIRDRGRVDRIAAGGVLVNVVALGLSAFEAFALRAPTARP